MKKENVKNLNIFKADNFIFMFKHLFTVVLIWASSCLVLAQNARPVAGTVIPNYGKTYLVENPEIKTETDIELKVIFDVGVTSKDKSVVNKNIETAARFLNMHNNAGVPKEQLKVAMTIHALAWQDVLNDEEYMKKFGVPNPNTKLINQLTKAGVELIICGQSAGKRAMTRDMINSNVKMALSATTALIQFQNKGYRFIKF
jgi:intracellular sulfur oxidation DsrE/DsrF family protein